MVFIAGEARNACVGMRDNNAAKMGRKRDKGVIRKMVWVKVMGLEVSARSEG